MGIRLREIRIEQGYRLKDVASAIGLTVSALSNYEQGLREPSIEILKKLCQFFNITSDYLIGLSDSY